VFCSDNNTIINTFNRINFLEAIYNVTSTIAYPFQLTVSLRSKMRMVLDRSNTGIVGSNPAISIAYVRVFLCSVVLCM